MLGQLLAQRYQTLYVNLETFCGAECLYAEPPKFGISELLYAQHAGERSIEDLQSEEISSFHGLDLLGPATAAEDLLKTSP